jgi:hypothetical protein
MKHDDGLTPDEREIIRKVREGWRVVTKPPPPVRRSKEGRPPILKGSKENLDRLKHIWLTIRIIRAQTKSIDAALDRLFTTYKSGNRVSKHWLAFVGDKEPHEIISKWIAKRRYYDAEKLRKKDPELCREWDRILKLALELGDDPLNYGIPPELENTSNN